MLKKPLKKENVISLLKNIPTYALADELAKREEAKDYILTETAALRVCVGDKDVLLEGPLRVMVVK
jgi:hypothetical protein